MRIIVLLTSILFTSFSHASTVELNYSIFFSYMKTMYKLDYNYVTTAFYLIDQKNKSACHINDAQMVVDNINEPILFQPEGRLSPFYSDQHRKDGAVLVVDINDDKAISSCALQVTVMAKESELSDLNVHKLTAISEQLQGVLMKNAGMIGKYFLPIFAGVRLQLSTPLSERELLLLGDNVSLANNGDLLLKQKNIPIIKKINELNLQINRITPWMLDK